jgi:hypothetical protein
VVHGYGCVRKYQTARAEENQTYRGFEDPDCFHNGHEVLKCVGDMHRHLLSTVRKTDFTTETVLGIVDEFMLRPRAQDRLDALPLHHETMLRLGKCMQQIEKDEEESGKTGRSNTNNRHSAARNNTSSSGEQPSISSRPASSLSRGLQPGIYNATSPLANDTSVRTETPAHDPFSGRIAKPRINLMHSNNPFWKKLPPSTATSESTLARGTNNNMSSIRGRGQYNSNFRVNSTTSQNPFRRSLPIIDNESKNEYKPHPILSSWKSDGQVPYAHLENEPKKRHSGFQHGAGLSIGMQESHFVPTTPISSPVAAAETSSNNFSPRLPSTPQRAPPQWKVKDALKWRMGPDRHELPSQGPDISDLEDRDYVRLYLPHLC